MWVKKFLLAVGICMSIPMAASAAAEIEKITPSQPSGVYEPVDEVGFTLEYQTDIDTKMQYVVTDIRGREQLSGTVEFQTGTASRTLELGRFPTGWYRVRFYHNGRENTDEYCAFSVTPPMSVKTTAENPFAADQAGQYMNWNDGQRAGYARALRLAGIDLVRERMSDTESVSYDPDIAAQANALAAEGIGVLEMLARNELIDYNENLFDVYRKSLDNAREYAGRVTGWESVNEAELSGAVPDEVASYYKARALGVLDSGSGAVKTFGGLCIWDTCFSEVFLQNDVLSYADNYNLHSHRSGTTELYNLFPGDQVFRARMLSTAYGGGRQVWVTEAGMNSGVDSRSLILDEYMIPQANYVITSAVESIARGGTDKHFWFLARHYIENGKEFGIFSYNDMPYPAYSALAVMTYYLGAGEFLGEVSLLPEGVRGYMFSDGINDTAVLWNTQNETRYVQLNTVSGAAVIDLTGNRTDISADRTNGKINIPVSGSPVIVKLQGKTENNYYPKHFPAYETTAVSSVNDAKRIVLKQKWQTKNTVNAKYEIQPGQEYVIELEVYNFSKKEMTGKISAKVSDRLIAEPSEPVSYRVGANGKTVLRFTVKSNGCVQTGGDAYLSFTGNAGGEELSPSVALCSVKADQSAFEVTPFDGYLSKDSWLANSPAKMTVLQEKNGIGFVFSFTPDISDWWAYPQLKIAEGTLADADGISFTRTCDTEAYPMDGVSTRVFLWTEEGDSYLANVGVCTDGEYSCQLAWSSFSKFGSTLSDLDPDKITRISVGFNAPLSQEPKSYYYKISDFGWFSGSDAEMLHPQITLKGINDRTVYRTGSLPAVSADIPEGLQDVKVYLNFEEYHEWNEKDGTLSVSLAELKEGAYHLMITGFDDFHYAVRAEVSFYLDSGTNGLGKGTFFD